MWKDYYALAKPGLVYGNLITVIAGFLLGARMAATFNINFISFFASLVGIALVMGSGCVFNNVIDQKIDAAMDRTKSRALVVGRISRRAALIYGVILGAAGFAALALWTNFLAVAVGAIGFVAYVFLYSMWAKRSTVWSTPIGSIAGAMPPVVGYAAAAGRLDLAAALLFVILVLWQMPHFYSIGIYRIDDYAAAGIPILPAKKGIRTTKLAMLFFIIAFIVVAPLLAVFRYTGPVYFWIALIFGLAWLGLCIKGFHDDLPNSARDVAMQLAVDKRWARKMFFLSLVVMMGLFITVAIGALSL